MSNGNDVIVVGAGIVGSSTAYHLAERGQKVTLIDQTHPAGGPSGKSSALLHAFYLMPELSQLAIRGREILVALPEIKTVDEGFPVQLIEDLGYHVEVHGQKGFNGVALLSRLPLEDVTRGLPGDAADEQARYIEATVIGR